MTDGEKWILYNNTQQMRSRGERNGPPPTISKAGLHPKKAMLCIWWDWKGVFYYELLLDTKQLQQVLLPITPTESNTRWKVSGISQQKMQSSTCMTYTCMFLWWSGKKSYSLDGKFWFICCAHQTMHLQTAIYFSLYKTLLLETISVLWKTIKGTGTALCSKR